MFLGASESIESAADLFTVVDKEHQIFRSRPVARRPIPVPEVTVEFPKLRGPKEKTAEQSRAMERLSYADLHQRMLEQYAPPSVVVNEDYDIVHLSDSAGRYLQIGGGEPSHNLLRVVRPELRLDLRTALYQAINDRINVETRGLKVGTEQDFHTVNIQVRPVLREEDPSRGFILVLFEQAREGEPAPATDEARQISEPITHRLEEELVHAKAQLRSTVEQSEIQQEELRASNEELQAMNEELRSTAEELETSKEELQSVNEELSTVNQELKIKIEELSQAYNNFQNLMNSTNIGTIFLDRSLKIRQFTPSAREIFNLQANDIGRPLMDLTSKLEEDHLFDDMESVLAKLKTLEREVATTNGRSYMMRIQPYRTKEDKIEGLVITFVDITDVINAKLALRRAGEELEGRVVARTQELANANEALRTEVAERKASQELRQQLLSQLVSAQEDERRRLARDLHDQLGQQLTTLRMKLEAMNKDADKRQVDTGELQGLESIVRQLDADVDFIAWQLRPVVLDDLGLAAALKNYVKQWSEHFGIPAEFHAGDPKGERFDPQVESNFYRIAQEALNNCAKHSRCSRAEVILERRLNDAVLIVADDGVGFDSQPEWRGDAGLGLMGMRERAALLGGQLEIESAAKQGTTIYVRAPLLGKKEIVE
jgi:two-component system CheB/CheR fusion protein